MSKRIVSALLIASVATVLSAGDFSAQADKDRKALQAYFEKKFESRKGASTFFPYSTKEELDKNYKWGIKGADFTKGSYAYDKGGRSQYEDINEMPPYEDDVDAGKELYEKKFANGKTFSVCFPDPAIAGEYPKFDNKAKKSCNNYSSN